MLFAPAKTYLDLYSLFHPSALIVNNTAISWKQFKEQFEMAEKDKTLKTRQQKINQAIIQIVQSETSKELSSQKEEQTTTNWRTGGYFIARFRVTSATESAQILKNQAREEIAKIQTSLQKGENFQEILKAASKNQVLKKLNASAFLPGMYLEKITKDQFPLQIQSFRELFFSLSPNTVSDIVTLSWDDYYGPAGDTKFTGEFAYAVMRIDQSDPQMEKDSQSRLNKQNIKLQSFVFVPFFFSWF